MQCKICQHNSEFLFQNKILNKYAANYYKCPNCGFVFIENVHWLSEAYSDAIAMTDVGMVSRTLSLYPQIYSFINTNIIPNNSTAYLDYGGGYGLLVRIMRDHGFNFYRYDKYCKNIFAQFFDIENYPHPKNTFSLVTAIELFEHLENPLLTTQELFTFSDTIVFTTELVHDAIDQSWWYFSPETGQHISFYSLESLKILARINNASFYTNGTLHCFSKQPFQFEKPSRFERLINKFNKKIGHSENSLTQHDFLIARNFVSNSQK